MQGILEQRLELLKKEFVDWESSLTEMQKIQAIFEHKAECLRTKIQLYGTDFLRKLDKEMDSYNWMVEILSKPHTMLTTTELLADYGGILGYGAKYVAAMKLLRKLDRYGCIKSVRVKMFIDKHSIEVWFSKDWKLGKDELDEVASNYVREWELSRVHEAESEADKEKIMLGFYCKADFCMEQLIFVQEITKANDFHAKWIEQIKECEGAKILRCKNRHKWILFGDDSLESYEKFLDRQKRIANTKRDLSTDV